MKKKIKDFQNNFLFRGAKHTKLRRCTPIFWKCTLIRWFLDPPILNAVWSPWLYLYIFFPFNLPSEFGPLRCRTMGFLVFKANFICCLKTFSWFANTVFESLHQISSRPNSPIATTFGCFRARKKLKKKSSIEFSPSSKMLSGWPE